MNDKEREINDQEPEKLEPEGHIPARYEASYLNLWTIILALAALAVMVVLVHLLAGALFGIFAAVDGNPQPPSPVISDAEPGFVPPEIEQRLQAQNQQQRLYATQTANLGSYGWLNQEGGVVAIPVEEAMRIMVEQGRPNFAERSGAPFEPPTPAGPEELAALGAQVFVDFSCNGCHREADSPAAPTLVGIFGEERPLTTGERIVADETYLRIAILEPNVHVVEGYQPIMPSFQGRLTETQLNSLVAYIASLGNP
jgi:mono/diheme cytochrome c family protein